MARHGLAESVIYDDGRTRVVYTDATCSMTTYQRFGGTWHAVTTVHEVHSLSAAHELHSSSRTSDNYPIPTR